MAVNEGVVLAALKALGNETKALIIVSELGARRMPSFQLRTIFNAIIKDEDERRIIVDLIDRELQANGLPEEQVFSLLNDLLTAPPVMQDSIQSTRRLRSPFAQNFESQMPAQIGVGLEPSPAPNGAPTMGPVPFNSRPGYAAGNAEPPRPGTAFFNQPPEEAPNYAAPQRTGSFAIPPQGFPGRGNAVRETGTFNIAKSPQRAPSQVPPSIDPRPGPGARPAPATQRYSQNAFHNPDELPPPIAKPAGFNKNGYGVPEQPGIPQPAGLPGFPGMPPPVSVRPSPPVQGVPTPPGGPGSQRRYDARLPSASADSVAQAAMLTPGLANVNSPQASKIVGRTDGSPNNFQGGVTANAPRNDGRPVILIADDDKRIRMVFRLRMEESGMTVVECADGTEAWERIQQGDITLAVLDMKMPGLHGLEVLSRMADKQYRIPVIVCSAYDQLKDEFVVQTYPRLRYLVKPVAPEQLVGSIKELLVRQPA